MGVNNQPTTPYLDVLVTMRLHERGRLLYVVYKKRVKVTCRPRR